MPVVFKKASNNELTCSINNIHLHSSYNPSREAEKFASSLCFSFTPGAILVTGPCLSYCAKYLRSQYPGIKLTAIRYCREFSSTDTLWDKVFTADSKNLCEELYDYFGDEGLVTTQFVSWFPSQQAFEKEYELSWKAIKNAVLKSRNVLSTRSYFAKRWMKNCYRFFLLTKKIYSVNLTQKPVIVCASGPSLKGCIQFLKDCRQKYFLLAVSSAVSPLIKNEIIPDLILSTDGGFWAKQHLNFCVEKITHVPVALPAEGALFARVLETNPVLPLNYEDGPSSDLMRNMKIESAKAFRNGTVSGTAALLALSLTDKKVFMTGLDLAENNSFSHTQPNEIEMFESQFDFRLKTKETRITPCTFKSNALEIYRSWFAGNDFNNRLFRLSNDYEFKNTLGQVKDVNVDWAHNYLDDMSETAEKTGSSRQKTENICETKAKLLDITKKYMTTRTWMAEAAPVENIIYERSRGTVSEQQSLKTLEKKIAFFYKDIMRSMGDENAVF